MMHRQEQRGSLGTALSLTAAPTPAGSRLFWRYWAGSTVSGVGTAVTSVALPLTAVLVVHASAFSVAAITAAGAMPWLVLGLPAGVYVSRLPLRGVQVSMDLLRAAAILSVPLVAWIGSLSVAQLVAVALLIGAASVPFSVANTTMIPSIVPPDELTKRNSLTAASRGISQLAGPSLGGLLVDAMGAASCMLIDAASYIISAAMLWGLPRPAVLRDSAERRSVREDIVDGLAFIRQQPIVRTTFTLSACINPLSEAAVALSPTYIVRTLHEPSYVLGLIYAAEGAGALAGAALAPRLSKKWGTLGVLRRCVLPVPLALALLPATFSGWGAALYALGFFGFTATLTVASITSITYQHRVIAPEMLPRIQGTTRVVSWGLAPLGALAAGALTTVLGIRGTLLLVAGSSLIIPITAWAMLRTVEPPERSPDSADS
jgi:hypothetical protein